MDDDNDYDADDLMDYEDGWLYVEDDFALSDELAENQLASPGYGGTNYEISLEGYEFELYAFWDDLEYADDAYWEYESSGPKSPSVSTGTQKRKRATTRTKAALEQRRKAQVKSVHEDFPGQNAAPVLFLSRKERDRRFLADPPPLEESESLAFMPDWRERFANADITLSPKVMPADMERAAEGDHIAESDSSMHDDTESAAEQDTAGDAEENLAGIDPETLMSVLRHKLGEAGLQGVDESMFMQIMTQMISGDGDVDEATGQLASSLLGKLSGEHSDEHVTGWLSQQGVSFEDEDHDEESSIHAEHMPRNPRRNPQKDNVDISEADDAVDLAALDITDHGHSLPSKPRTRKRKQQVDTDEDSKRRKVSPSVIRRDGHSKEVQSDQASIDRGLADSNVQDPEAMEGVSTSGNPVVSTMKANHAHAGGGRKSRRVNGGPSEPASTSTPVAQRTRNARTKGKERK